MADHGNALRNSSSFVSFSSIRSSARRLTTSLSPVKQQAALFLPPDSESPPRTSIASSSTSSAPSPQTPKNGRMAGDSSASFPFYPDTQSSLHDLTQHPPPPPAPPISSPVQSPLKGLRIVDGVWPRAVALSKNRSSSFPAMIVTPFANSLRPENGKPSQATNTSPLPHPTASTSYAPTPHAPTTTGNTQTPSTVYQQIQEISSKRISTLDYLRKAHDGRVYWFNTLRFSKSDLGKMPYFDARKLARRATNYLLLGLSLPNILDTNATNVLEYLRALNALLIEFESYQQIHPPDGSSASSLSRARIPHIFKRATHVTGSKGRRASSATDIGLPLHTSDAADSKAMAVGGPLAGLSSTSSFPVNDHELLPGEEYTHLITPSLPFDPDFFETFSTLCDVLIDCYTRIMSLVPSPSLCVPGVSETFIKADAKLRKIIVAGIVKDFEEASRGGAKSEITSISKVVLGGLM